MSWEELRQWGWSLVLLVLGGIGTVFTRWISMLHKHEKQLVILENGQQLRVQTDRQMLESVATLSTKIESNLREDFKTLLEFARRQDDRG
jgi:hypothetical protein